VFLMYGMRIPWSISNPFPMAYLLPPLYPILDASVLPLENRFAFLDALCGELLQAGVSLLQYRNKTGSDRELLDDAACLRGAMPTGRCLLVLNDRPDLAVIAGFDGVHVGQQDLSPAAARAVVGPHRIVGVSTHNALQLRVASQAPVDYVAIGPVFATASKLNPDPVVGLDGIRMARALTSLPLVAIGGITPGNCRQVRDAGADSVAVISSLFQSTSGDSPAVVAKDFLAHFR
jgi:thiamine-phosphate pyrophosphorylase